MTATQIPIDRLHSSSIASGATMVLFGLFAALPLAHTPVGRALMVVVLAGAGLHALFARRIGFSGLRPLGVALPWLLWCTLSYFWSLRPALTFSSLVHDLWLPCLGLFGVYCFFLARDSRIFLWAAIVGSATGSVGTVLGSWNLTKDLVWGSYFFTGVGCASTFAVYFLALLLPWLSAPLARSEKLLVVAMIVANVAAGLATQNRIFVVAAAALFVIHAALHLKRVKASSLIGLTLIVASVSAAGFFWASEKRFDKESGKDNSAFAAVATDPRLSMWPHWLAHAQDRPLSGAGFGRDLPRKLLTASDVDSLRRIDPFGAVHAHNLFINALLETGAIGLLLFAGFLAALAYKFLRARERHPLAASTGLLLIAALVLKNLTDDFVIFAPALLFYAALGFPLACLHRQPSAAS